MRAGAFAEKRVIDLINRRFAPVFFSTGGPGKGHDKAAQAFVKNRTKNKWAFLCVFTTDGRCLGESEIYAGKDEVFDFLVKILAEHPEMNAETSDEKAILARGRSPSALPADIAAAAAIEEELGRYDAASSLLLRLAKADETPYRAAAQRARLRITRYRKAWKEHEAILAEYSADTAQRNHDQGIDIAIERGYALIAASDFAAARKTLQTAAAAAFGKARETEAHFLAGVACWMSGDRDWAKFHWCEIVSRFPDDRFYMRARIAAAAESMPYPNAELGNFESDTGPIGTEDITRAVTRALRLAAKLKPKWDAGEMSSSKEPLEKAPSESSSRPSEVD